MKTALQIGLTALLVGAIAFYGGVMFGRVSGRAGLVRMGAQGGYLGGQGGSNANGANGNAARMRIAGGFADGEVIGSDAKSITVKMADGSTKTVYFDKNTRVVRSEEATVTDLAKGTTVVVIGQAGNDGSVTARSVQIVPKGANLDLFRGGMRGFGGQGAQNGRNTQGNNTGGDQGGDNVFVPGPGGGSGGPPPGQ